MSEIATVRESNGSTPGKHDYRRAVAPPVDVFENADEVLVVADVPGVASDAVDVRVENDTLTLETRRASGEDKGVPALAREYVEVEFARSFRIPAGIDTTQIAAEARNGTITVRLPKAAAAKPRKITVRSG